MSTTLSSGHYLSGGLNHFTGVCQLDVPRQLFLDASYRMISDASVDMSNIRFGFETIEFYRPDQAIYCAGDPSAACFFPGHHLVGMHAVIRCDFWIVFCPLIASNAIRAFMPALRLCLVFISTPFRGRDFTSYVRSEFWGTAHLMRSSMLANTRFPI